MSPHPCSMDKSCDGTGKAQTSSLLSKCIQNITWRPSVYYQSRARGSPGHPLPPKVIQFLPGKLQHKAPWLLPHLKIINPTDRQWPDSHYRVCLYWWIFAKPIPGHCHQPAQVLWEEGKFGIKQELPVSALFPCNVSSRTYMIYMVYIYFLPLYLGLQWLFLFYQSVGLLLTGCSHKR